MREILFRGKRIDNGAWIEGDLLQNIDAIKIRELEKEKREIVKSYEVYPETVGEYTGLTDKHGRNIFEGDIIDFDEREWGSKYVETVKFDYDYLSLRQSDFNEWCEIIGNIHDNPELLEEKC